MDRPVYNFSGALNKSVGLLFGGLSQGGHLVCTTEKKIEVAYCILQLFGANLKVHYLPRYLSI
jgi:hypothetical protein